MTVRFVLRIEHDIRKICTHADILKKVSLAKHGRATYVSVSSKNKSLSVSTAATQVSVAGVNTNPTADGVIESDFPVDGRVDSTSVHVAATPGVRVPNTV